MLHPEEFADQEAKAAIKQLPLHIRRRLDQFGRIAARVALPCLDGQGDTPLVFASRHGSLTRTTSLLMSMARHEPLSPASFSLSVHNSVPGVLSIARADTSPATAVAAGAATLGAAVLEALAQLYARQHQVLIVCVDEPACTPYDDPLAYPNAAFGLALLLRKPGNGLPEFELRWRQNARDTAELPAQMVTLLSGERDSAMLDLESPCWTVQRRFI